MKTLFVVILAVALFGCDDSPKPVTNYWEQNGWTMVVFSPEESTYSGIYKKHSDTERATFYMTKNHYGWAMSVVPDRER